MIATFVYFVLSFAGIFKGKVTLEILKRRLEDAFNLLRQSEGDAEEEIVMKQYFQPFSI